MTLELGLPLSTPSAEQAKCQLARKEFAIQFAERFLAVCPMSHLRGKQVGIVAGSWHRGRLRSAGRDRRNFTASRGKVLADEPTHGLPLALRQSSPSHRSPTGP